MGNTSDDCSYARVPGYCYDAVISGWPGGLPNMKPQQPHKEHRTSGGAVHDLYGVACYFGRGWFLIDPLHAARHGYP